MSTEKTTAEDFNILDMFAQQAKSSELPTGIHERVKLITIDGERRKDKNGNLVKKQLFLKFKKFSSTGADVGEIAISFFLVDPARDSALNNLHLFISQTRELLSIYLSEEEIEKGFDPLSVLHDAEDEGDVEDSEVEARYLYDSIKKSPLKKASGYAKVEKAVCSQFTSLLSGMTGFDSEPFRLKLEASQDGNYVQIPRYDRFIEKANVKKEDSLLYSSTK